MDRNAFLAFALSFLVLSLWMSWEAKNRPTPPPDAGIEQAAPTDPSAAHPAAPPPPPGAAPTTEAAQATPPVVAPAEEATTTTIDTGALRAVLTSRGAGIERAELDTYQLPDNEGGGPVVMIDTEAGRAPAFATPLPELGLGDLGQVVFRVVEETPTGVVYEYARSGVVVRKTFVFDPETHRFRVRVGVANQANAPISPSFGIELLAAARSQSDFRDLYLAVFAAGSVEREFLSGFGTPGFFGGQPELQRSFTGEIAWAGKYSHYFIAAILPDAPREARARWDAVEPGMRARITVDHPPVAVLPGTSLEREYAAFVGPKDAELLTAAGAQLDRSIDLGWSWIAPFTRAFVWLLKACYQIIPNYGVAIILLTVLVRLVTAPLAAKQMRSMKRMGELQPKIKAIQEKHPDDRQMQSQEMMKLYREAGVNPLGGCLPLLLQFPVLIGLYYALQSSIDLRQAPFTLWIDDLSQPETLFTIPGVEWPVRVLPILMTLSMVVQQKMTPQTAMDPVQARTMMIVMPVMFFFMFYGFPSGLVLYWFVSNLLAIAQQMYLNRQMTPKAA
jgi:YidC/Oxa1 family membrane protein insertase